MLGVRPRKIVQWIAQITVLTGAITFVIATYMKDDGPAVTAIWRVSAYTGLAAVIIELFLRRLSDKDSTELQRTLDETKQDAADAKGQSEQLRKENALMRQRFAPRFLTEEQQLLLAEKMQKWRGQIVMFFVHGDDESIQLMKVIRSRLVEGAGWVLSSGWGPGGVSIEGALMTHVRGVIIQSTPNSLECVTSAASKFSETLNEFGIEAAAGVSTDQQLGGHADTLFIAVGSKN